jgi:acyl-CoA dehydrogenase
LQQDVKEHGLWAAHLPIHLGGRGFGALKLTYMNELFGTGEQKRKYLKPLLANDLFSSYATGAPGRDCNHCALPRQSCFQLRERLNRAL